MPIMHLCSDFNNKYIIALKGGVYLSFDGSVEVLLISFRVSQAEMNTGEYKSHGIIRVVNCPRVILSRVN
jgi:hypothetical protein